MRQLDLGIFKALAASRPVSFELIPDESGKRDRTRDVVLTSDRTCTDSGQQILADSQGRRAPDSAAYLFFEEVINVRVVELSV
ncbi:hypothetical protein A2U19_02580 [Dietzia maris]|nr:hypothetical protein A2U19_02580 [Dietzia maris]